MPTNETELTLPWICSEGGPLLLLSEEYLPAWKGCDVPSGGRVIQATFRWNGPGSPATDYDRACDVNGYVDLLDVGSGHGLVLGDEPMETMWWHSEVGDGGILVRWGYADDEARVVHSLARIPDDVWEETSLLFTVGQSPLYLFDSAWPGREVSRHLVIQVPQGTYSVATGIYRPDDRTELVLHRLRLTAPGD
jgi:hypothetical protein